MTNKIHYTEEGKHEKILGGRLNCIACGTTLRPHYIRVHEPLAPDGKGRPALRSYTRTSIYKIEGEQDVTHYTFFGDYGNNGDNAFCSMRCGYLWAVSQVQKNRRAQREASNTRSES